MKFLLDANPSPALGEVLRSVGHVAVHVADLGLLTATDDAILDRALTDGLTLITADSDFPTMLALRRARNPSVVLLRHVNELSPGEQGKLLVANLPAVLEDLDRGSIVSLSPRRMSVRRLPIE